MGMEEEHRQSTLDELVEEIIGSFRIINRGLRRRLSAHDAAGLSVPQMIAIRLVAREPGLALSELSRRMGLANSTVTGLVDRLERDGLVTRSPDPQDRRVTRLLLTPLALERRERYAAVHRAALAEVLGRLSPEDLAALRRSLAALAQAVETQE